MNRRQVVRWALVVGGGVLLTPLLFIAYIMAGFHFSGGNGSMAEAQRIRPRVEAVTDPDSMPRGNGWAAVTCANGEWLLGISISSHGLYSSWYGGGTVVLKDSRGRVRCFLGHVCGDWDNELRYPNYASLDDVDETLASCRITEHPWP